MTGGSLGSRTSGTYGSLQQSQNGGLQPYYPNIPRMPSKTSLTGSRGKERFFPSSFRYLIRRKGSLQSIKVPKLLLQRHFPNTQYPIWIDGKLQLVVDPYQILERFFWLQNATFAISRHYGHFDRGFNTIYTTAKLPITSDVPEGCLILRESTAIPNLFNCMWFGKVDQFTSSDQLSFSTVRDKVAAKVNWSINTFLDCERLLWYR
ncbi:hypothetical protein Pfo_014120 [Paulownia fortunei]|nr:hypothetical protein Pfo_014120 [Paulownia fortunei]